jgi:hypothetical protein
MNKSIEERIFKILQTYTPKRYEHLVNTMTREQRLALRKLEKEQEHRRNQIEADAFNTVDRQMKSCYCEYVVWQKKFGKHWRDLAKEWLSTDRTLEQIYDEDFKEFIIMIDREVK